MKINPLDILLFIGLIFIFIEFIREIKMNFTKWKPKPKFTARPSKWDKRKKKI